MYSIVPEIAAYVVCTVLPVPLGFLSCIGTYLNVHILLHIKLQQ